jgi:23S rRNA (cytosine1962-C5)-methyltransferase
VLDCYCYQGIWSLLALKHGARRVTGVDSSADALDLASEHAEANGMAASADWIRGDVLDLLKGFRSGGRSFDLVILDPPAFVRSRKHLKAGMRGYLDLNRKGMEVVAPGGYLITCSCSHHVGPEQFADTVAHAAGLSGREVRILASLGQSRDHPPLLTAPETSYLKCLALHLE